MTRVRYAFALAPLLWLTGCGGARPGTVSSGAATEPQPEYVRVDGVIANPTPIADLNPAARGLYEDFESAVAAELPPPGVRSLQDTARWAREELMPFVSAHTRRLAELERRATILARQGDTADRLFAALVVGRAWERFYELLVELPAPREVANDGELTRVYRTQLVSTALPIARRAGAAYRACAQQPEIAGVEAWHTRCRERAARLEAVEPPPRPRATTGHDPSDSAAGVGQDEPTSALGALDPNTDASILMETCDTDEDCRDGMECAALGATADGSAVRACQTPTP